MALHANMPIDSLINLKLINNVEDIVVFLGLKVFNYDNCSRNALYYFVENPRLKITSF